MDSAVVCTHVRWRECGTVHSAHWTRPPLLLPRFSHCRQIAIFLLENTKTTSASKQCFYFTNSLSCLAKSYISDNIVVRGVPGENYTEILKEIQYYMEVISEKVTVLYFVVQGIVTFG
jgi:hypothetical protein